MITKSEIAKLIRKMFGTEIRFRFAKLPINKPFPINPTTNIVA